MRDAFRLVYSEAIRTQAERERAIVNHEHGRADYLGDKRDGLIEAMVAMANAATGIDKIYLASYNTTRKAWDAVFANAGDVTLGDNLLVEAAHHVLALIQPI